jgi:hypothetical protein
MPHPYPAARTISCAYFEYGMPGCVRYLILDTKGGASVAKLIHTGKTKARD